LLKITSLSISLFFNDSFITSNSFVLTQIRLTSSLIFENKTQILKDRNDPVSDLAALEFFFRFEKKIRYKILNLGIKFKLKSGTGITIILLERFLNYITFYLFLTFFVYLRLKI